MVIIIFFLGALGTNSKEYLLTILKAITKFVQVCFTHMSLILGGFSTATALTSQSVKTEAGYNSAGLHEPWFVGEKQIKDGGLTRWLLVHLGKEELA